uniref:Os08g0383700 protein n=1 Tax=Macrostomum lignano TaxID=282301 RepID=A0A1I8FAA8_9PLAT
PRSSGSQKADIFATTAAAHVARTASSPTGDKSVPSAPGSRQKSRASQAGQSRRCHHHGDNTDDFAPTATAGRIRSAVTVGTTRRRAEAGRIGSSYSNCDGGRICGCLGRPRVRVATERLQQQQQQQQQQQAATANLRETPSNS